MFGQIWAGDGVIMVNDHFGVESSLKLQISVMKSIEKHHSYRTLKAIGKGSFGRVDLVESETDGKRHVIKKLQVRPENKQNIMKEVEIMRDLKHQFIIRYYESFIDADNNLCIVMEFAENGELEQYLNRRKEQGQPLSQDEVLEWFIQLCLGLKHIHDHRILHRDLKCENIFITSQNELKIGDFGISKLMSETFDMAKTKIGTPYVMAPQIWENKMYNQKSDIWSLGCIFYKIMTLSHAFEAKNPGSYIIKITSGKFEPIMGNYSKQLKQLISSMLSLEAEKRPSVHSILQMDFIKKYVPKVLESALTKYQETISLHGLQKRDLSNNQLLSKKRSFSSLSNSSMLTPKHTSVLENTKMVEMKQSFPILMEQVKQLRKESENQQRSKEIFVEGVRQLLEQGKENTGMTKEELASVLDHRLTQYLYP